MARAAAPSTHVSVAVEGRELQLSNLDKVLYPEAGFTKAQVIDYYTRIAPVLLPHLRDRPLTLKRYPNGVDGEMFYEKNCPRHAPDWVQKVEVWSRSNKRFMSYCMVQDLPTLVWVANLASLELHTSLSLGADMPTPRVLAFDLDPGPPADVVQCCQVALWLRDFFAVHGVQCFPKTSGSKGLQVYVPINSPASYEDTKRISRGLALRLEKEHPGAVVHQQDKVLRPGKVLIDWSQNDDSKTTVNVYSLRARPRPTASTPLLWEEVEATAAEGKAERLVFTSDDVLARVEHHGDLFAPVLTLEQRLPEP